MYSNADVAAVQAAEFRLDAAKGSWLIKRWAAVWYRQGFDAFLQGKARDTLPWQIPLDVGLTLGGAA